MLPVIRLTCLAARARGFDSRLVPGTARDVRDAVRAGRPAILMLRVLDANGNEMVKVNVL